MTEQSTTAPSDKLELELGYNAATQQFKVKVGGSLSNPFGNKKRSWWELPLSPTMTRYHAGNDARNEAVNGLKAGEDELSDREHRVFKVLEAKLQPLGTYLRNFQTAVLGYIDGNRPTQQLSAVSLKGSIETRSTELKSYFEKSMQGARQDWSEALVKRDELRKRHKDFREANGLKREEAKYPDDMLKPISFVAFTFIVDGLVNATLFAGASSAGFVGGLMYAFILSLVNVSLGIGAGWFGIRNIFYRDTDQPWRRWVGYASAAIFIILGLWLNLLVAHFRDVAEKTLELAQSGVATKIVSIENIDLAEVFGQMGSDPFGLHSFVGLLLMFTGLIVFLIGGIEGYRGFDDSYPFFGDIQRSLNKAENELRERKGTRVGAQNAARLLINAFIVGVRRSLTAAISNHEIAKTEIASALDALDRDSREATEAEKRVHGGASRHLVTYRRTYRKVWGKVSRKSGSSEKMPSRFAEGGAINLPTFVPDTRDAQARSKEVLGLIDKNLLALRETQSWFELHAKAVNQDVDRLEKGAEDEERNEIARVRKSDASPASSPHMVN